MRLLLLAVTLLLLMQLWFAAHVAYWVHYNPGSTAFMRARLSLLREGNPKAVLKHQWAPYARISPHLKRALIAAEDAKFLEHRGFDWDGIKQAWERNRKQKTIVAGGSTISQQLAKNLLFSGNDTADAVSAFGTGWTGAAPYTVLIGTNGEILYREQGGMNSLNLRRAIVKNLPDDNFLGQHDYWNSTF